MRHRGSVCLVSLEKRWKAACLVVPIAAPITVHESPASRATAAASRFVHGKGCPVRCASIRRLLVH